MESLFFVLYICLLFIVLLSKSVSLPMFGTDLQSGNPKHRTSLMQTSVLLSLNLRTFAQRSPMFLPSHKAIFLCRILAHTSRDQRVQLINCQRKSGTMPLPLFTLPTASWASPERHPVGNLPVGNAFDDMGREKRVEFYEKIRLALVHYASLSYLCPCKQESLCNARAFRMPFQVRPVSAQCIPGICLPDEGGCQHDGPLCMPYPYFCNNSIIYDIYRLCWSDWDTHQLLPTTENASVQWRAGATL